jgi:hypothetical protein
MKENMILEGMKGNCWRAGRQRLLSERCSAPNWNVRTIPNNRLSALFSLPHPFPPPPVTNWQMPLSLRSACLILPPYKLPLSPNHNILHHYSKLPFQIRHRIFYYWASEERISFFFSHPPFSPIAFLCQNCNHCSQELMQKYCFLIAAVSIESISVFCRQDGGRVLAEN